MTESATLDHLQSTLGVRIYGRAIVSPYSTRDSAAKMQLINFMVEKCGYTLADEKAFPPKLPAPAEEALP
ncbi:MAG: hypothetical protein IMZ69_04955 [Spirochaetes bacterium]|nr:hypothetical protein [Spirochaetota bacterium]